MKILREAIKEPVREILLAVIPGFLAYLGTIDAGWAFILYIILRSIDSYLHQIGRAKGNKLITGLTRF